MQLTLFGIVFTLNFDVQIIYPYIQMYTIIYKDRNREANVYALEKKPSNNITCSQNTNKYTKYYQKGEIVHQGI